MLVRQGDPAHSGSLGLCRGRGGVGNADSVHSRGSLMPLPLDGVGPSSRPVLQSPPASSPCLQGRALPPA